ncbi:MAG: SIR2 family protein [Acidimicrobiia bacterium]|nr:SIR2 family protein [Acidimicrobiia bacterium]
MTGTTRIFTLNYDALIDGAAIEVRDQKSKRIRLSWKRGIVLGDMAQGFGQETVDIVPDGPATAYPLRDDDEYKPANLLVYHLHGSLQWLRRNDGSIWKVDHIERMRELDFWVRYGRGETALEPVVVLADQKARAVELDPFRWAYDRFEDALRSADKLVIAGYGFGDLPVNRALARGLENAQYPVQCIDYTDDVAGFKASLASRIAGEEPGAKATAARLAKGFARTLRVSGLGVPAALDDLSWTKT